MARQLTLQPYRGRITSDPTPAHTVAQYSGKISAEVQICPNSETYAYKIDAIGNITIFCPQSSDAKYVTPTALTYTALLDMALSYFRIATTNSIYELNIHKFSLWGPSTTDWPLSTICMNVDLGSPFAHLNIHDTGTNIARPKICIVIPNNTWYGPSTTSYPVILSLDPRKDLPKHSGSYPSDSYKTAGTFQMSFTVRIGPQVVNVSQNRLGSIETK